MLCVLATNINSLLVGRYIFISYLERSSATLRDRNTPLHILDNYLDSTRFSYNSAREYESEI